MKQRDIIPVVNKFAAARQPRDFAYWQSRPPAERLAALEQFGFGALGLCPDDFLEPDQVIQLGYAPNRIDLLTAIPGVEFEKCYPNQVTTDLDGLTVPFIDLESLKQNKKATGRHQDLADVENLETP